MNTRRIKASCLREDLELLDIANAGNQPLRLCAIYNDEDGTKRIHKDTGEESEFHVGTLPEPETAVKTKVDRVLPKGSLKPPKATNSCGSKGAI